MEREISDILRSLRAEKKATQSDLADMLELTTNAYQSYERGVSEPSCKALRKLADFYNVSTDYLLGRTPVREMNTLAEGELTEDEVKRLQQEIYESYCRMSEETRRICIEALRSVVGDVFDVSTEPTELAEPEPSTPVKKGQVLTRKVIDGTLYEVLSDTTDSPKSESKSS